MKMIRYTVLAAGVVTALGTSPSLAGPISTGSYFVQPVITYGNSMINGLEVNGATSKTEGYNNAPNSVNSTIDLYNGTIKGNVDNRSPNFPLGAQGRLGERITVTNGAGGNATFNFAVEGTVKADARPTNTTESTFVNVEAYIAIFDSSVGANASNWWDMSFNPNGTNQTIGRDRYFRNFSNSTTDVNTLIDTVLSVSAPLTHNNQSFDIFANLSLLSVIGNLPVEISMDFSNTARFGIDLPDGASFTSASGVFLTGGDDIAPIPLPAGAPLLVAALGMLGLLRRRRG